MDFSILNILVRTRSLPASDPWLAGAPLGYYTFGQEMVVFLTLLTNLSTRFTFNLAFGLLGGDDPAGRLRARPQLGRDACAPASRAAALTLLLGNLVGPARVAASTSAHLDWDYFWATSRVIKRHDQRVPALEPHVRGPPRARARDPDLPALRRGGAPPRAPPRRARRAPARARSSAPALLGFLGAAQALTNAWDVPLLSGLLVLVAADRGPRRRRASRSPSLGPRRASRSLAAAASGLRCSRGRSGSGSGSAPGDRQEPRAVGLGRRPAHRVRPLLLPRRSAGGSPPPRTASARGGRGRALAIAARRSPRRALALPRLCAGPTRSWPAASCSSSAAFFALAETPRGPAGARLPRAPRSSSCSSASASTSTTG